jgi:hypothetical protein
MAIVSSPGNIRTSKIPADFAKSWRTPKASPKSRRTQLAREGKAVVWIDGGLHASESVGSQQLMEWSTRW